MMNVPRLSYILIILIILCVVVKSAKILAIFPSPGYSQYLLVEPLLIALAKRGHNVTVISAFESKNVTNLKNIVVNVREGWNVSPGKIALRRAVGWVGCNHIGGQARKIMINLHTEFTFRRQDLSVFANIMFLNGFGLHITEKLLADVEVQELIHSEEKFDLVLVETFFNDAHQAFAKHFNAHQVLFHSMSLNDWNSHLVANPNIPSYLPHSFGGYTTHMSFIQRFRNTMGLWFSHIYKRLVQQPAQQGLVNRYFPGNYNLNEIIYNASLMLTCSHVSTAEAAPLTTSVVEVGGLHIKSQKLPDDIKKFLDSANDGAIFFTMGSNVKSSNLPKKVIDEIVVAIGKLKQKVLWKFEDDGVLENKPDNLMISKWFPQSDILGHPNTIILITHCGMGSLTEAVYHGVPVLGIPIFADQFTNIRRLALFGMGLEISIKTLSGKTFEDSVNELLNNPKYKDNAKRKSRIMKDRPMNPLDLAVYWVEYVLRQDGAHHLKNSIHELAWYQLYLLDVIGLLLAILLAISYVLFVVVCFIRRCFVAKRKIE